MERVIQIGDRKILFRASALTVSKYRDCFRIDLLSELDGLSELAKEDKWSGALWCMGMFERLAYVMAVHTETPVPDYEAWIGSFPTLALREALPEIEKLWLESMGTTVESKKKRERRPGKALQPSSG